MTFSLFTQVSDSGPHGPLKKCLNVKVLKLGHLRKLPSLSYKSGTFWYLNLRMLINGVVEIASSVDPVQTLYRLLLYVRSSLIWVYTVCHIGEILRDVN